jgi:hypothetical protein
VMNGRGGILSWIEKSLPVGTIINGQDSFDFPPLDKVIDNDRVKDVEMLLLLS